MLHNIIKDLINWMGKANADPAKVVVYVRSEREEARLRRKLCREAESLHNHAFEYQGFSQMEYFGVPFRIEVEPCSKCGRKAP